MKEINILKKEERSEDVPKHNLQLTMEDKFKLGLLKKINK